MFRYLKILLILFGLLFASSWLNIAQEQDNSTPTIEEIEISLFPDDDCEQTCWMGLIVGESTAEDVERTLEILDDALSYWRLDPDNAVIDAETGYPIHGTYYFKWQEYNNTGFRQLASLIVIENSVVDLILIYASEPISLEEILNNLEQPDDIRFASEYQAYNLTLIYIDELIEVRYGMPETCSIQTIDDDSRITFIYRNYEDASELTETDYGLQPSLLAYESVLGAERQVPLDTLNTWLNLEEDSHCFYLWESLPETIELPEFPAPEVTEASSEE